MPDGGVLIRITGGWGLRLWRPASSRSASSSPPFAAGAIRAQRGQRSKRQYGRRPTGADGEGGPENGAAEQPGQKAADIPDKGSNNHKSDDHAVLPAVATPCPNCFTWVRPPIQSHSAPCVSNIGLKSLRFRVERGHGKEILQAMPCRSGRARASEFKIRAATPPAPCGG